MYCFAELRPRSLKKPNVYWFLRNPCESPNQGNVLTFTFSRLSFNLNLALVTVSFTAVNSLCVGTSMFQIFDAVITQCSVLGDSGESVWIF